MNVFVKTLYQDGDEQARPLSVDSIGAYVRGQFETFNPQWIIVTPVNGSTQVEYHYTSEDDGKTIWWQCYNKQTGTLATWGDIGQQAKRQVERDFNERLRYAYRAAKHNSIESW